MKTRFLINESLGALRSNLLRSLLTIIGIVVGIFSVTAMLALGAGLSQNVMERFSSFAAGDLTASGDITQKDFAWISNQPYVAKSVALGSINGITVIANQTEFSPTIQFAVGDYADIQSFEVTSGNTFDFSSSTYNEKVALVSSGFVESVTEEVGGTPAVGDTISISGQDFTILGILESSSMSFSRGDGLIIVPYATTVGTLTSSKYFSSVATLLVEADYYDIAGTALLSGLNASRQLTADSEDIFSVETAQSFIESAEETTGMISLFLGIVGGIALFVGGIGTMNMMLTTVTERTKEIGLRKAIGARNRDIMLQILLESVALTTLGGFIGILLSLGAAKVANTIFADSEIISVVVNTQVVMLAAIVAVAVGVIFGLYPARNAARLQPVDALRSE
jgi:putative ABC transport system permease protein